jgi:curved DNA-binding protein CbpA
MKEKENFYEIFSLPNFSPFEDIKLKYKQLIRISHPDKGGDREDFQKIKKAYDYLKEPNLKSEYDRNLKCNLSKK